MTHASWIDTVWSMGGAKIPIFGCVRSVEGEDLTISVIGPTNQHPQGAEILPSTGKRRCARIPVAALLQHWTPVDGVNANSFRGHTRRIRTEID
jgi:hypothetical protein